MFDHVQIRVSDREASERFYDTVLRVLGKRRIEGDDYTEWARTSISGPTTLRRGTSTSASTRRPTSSSTRSTAPALTPDFKAMASRVRDRSTRPSTTAPSCSTRTATASRPFTREGSQARPDRPPVAAHRAMSRRATAFYATIAPIVGLEVRRHSPDHVQLAGDGLSFSFVTGEEPTRERPHRLHRARRRDRRRLPRGSDRRRLPRQRRPGERPIYHPGYYGAFVLDPDGHNIEAVNHNR